MVTAHETRCKVPARHPYPLLTPQRYGHLMALKATGRLKDRVRKCPESNFRRNWLVICRRVGLADVAFHDLRATCITEWFEQGMMPHEVQRLAGHASIETTMKYYVGIRETMLGRARAASAKALSANSVANLLPVVPKPSDCHRDVTSRDTQTPVAKELTKIGATGLEPATS